MTPTRKLNWVSAIDSKNSALLSDLQRRMSQFYASSASYYSEIDFTEKAWREDECYLDIVKRLEPCGSIVEVGCGSANILRHHPRFASRYSGCDFSSELLGKNQTRYPQARFQRIEDPRTLPFITESADAVFSVYVIEHTIYPHLFLDECCRVLKPGGLFILRCPDFLGSGRMTSQRAGFSNANGREKLAKGKIMDAVITGWDRKVAIPGRCAELRKRMGNGSAFWLNLAPTCFTDPFIPDVDAIYLTYSHEMISHLKGRVEFEDPFSGISGRSPIYLTGHKSVVSTKRL